MANVRAKGLTIWLALLLLASMSASACLVMGISLSVTAEEMQYNPVHDAQWQQGRGVELAAASRFDWASVGFVLGATASVYMAFRSREGVPVPGSRAKLGAMCVAVVRLGAVSGALIAGVI